MNGGSREYNESDETFIPITSSDITIMMELGMIIDPMESHYVLRKFLINKNINKTYFSLYTSAIVDMKQTVGLQLMVLFGVEIFI